MMSASIKLGLLGNNIGRSRAKNLHELMAELYGLNLTYQPMDLKERTAPVSIQVELERCRREGFHGVNVTHPYKQKAFESVTPVGSFPAGLTSINTVLFQDGAMIADNTDYSGFCRAFGARFGEGARPGRILMLGAGGVGVAIAYALQKLGAEELVIADTDRKLAAELVDRLDGGAMRARLAGSDLEMEALDAQGLINATPIGMFQYPGCAFPRKGLGGQQWAFDAVYTPEETEFLHHCRRRGIDTLSGFKLFLYQGLDAFRLFTGITPEAGEVEPLFLQRYPLE